MITISIEIHFTTLYMADLGTRAEPLGEGALKPLWSRRENGLALESKIEEYSAHIIGCNAAQWVNELMIDQNIFISYSGFEIRSILVS